MHHKPLRWIVIAALVGAFPIAARADYLANAKAALQKGDLKSAQIDLRNAVRDDPQNAESITGSGASPSNWATRSPRNARPPPHGIVALIHIRPLRYYRGPSSRSTNSTRCWSS